MDQKDIKSGIDDFNSFVNDINFLLNKKEEEEKEKVKEEKKEKEEKKVELEKEERKILKVLSGEDILIVCDYLFPGAIKFIWGFVDDDAKKINVKDIQLDDDDRERLLPLAKRCAEYISLYANPLLLFSIIMGSRYFFAFKFAIDLKKIEKKYVAKNRNKYHSSRSEERGQDNSGEEVIEAVPAS